MTIKNYIKTFIIIVVIYSCGSTEKNDKKVFMDFELLSELINDTYKRNIDFINKQFGDTIKQKAINENFLFLIEESEEIINQINSGIVNNDQVESYFTFCEEIINKYLQGNDIRIDKKICRDDSLLIYKLKFLEYVSTNLIINKYQSILYSFDEIEIKVIPVNANISLGEEYQADIYLIANNQYNPCDIIIRDGKIKEMNTGVATYSEYRFTPPKRGNYQKDGFLVFISGDTIPFNFSFKVEQFFVVFVVGSVPNGALKMN